MSTLPANATPEEIEEELGYYAICISTLDPDADDYQTDLDRYQEVTADLERRLAAMQSNPGPSNPGHFGVDGAADQHSDGASWWQVAMNSRPASNHSTSSSAASVNHHGLGGPSGLSVNGNKRTRPESSNFEDHMSNKRLTPEPSRSTLTSHASHDSRGPSERAQMHQRAAEAAIRRQAELQQADAAFARQLSQSNSFTSSGTPTSSRPSVQTTINHDGTFHRRPPTVHPSPSPLAQHPSHYGGSSTLSHNNSNHNFIKPEPSSAGSQQQLVRRPREPPPVVDLTGSDSEDELEEIAPTRFTPNSRPAPRAPNGYSHAGMRSLHTPTPTTMQQPNNMTMPGAYPSDRPPPGFQTFVNSAPNGGRAQNGGPSSAGHVYRSPFLNDAMSGIRNASATLGSQMQELSNLVYGSSRSRPLDLDDDDELIYGGSRQLGNYAGNQALYDDRYAALANYDPAKSKAEIEALLENIRPDEEMPAHLRVTTPRDMNVQLHKYQELGLTWLKNCEEGSTRGGCLADDMGLGKTIQMLSLIVERKSDDPLCKTTLIIAPVALMRQWKQEISTKIKPTRRLSVIIHHGQSKKKSFSDLQTYDVVLTTYGSIASELKKLEAFRRRQVSDPDARPYPREKCVLLDPNANWYRVVLDEAQCIKNRNTQTAKAACLLRAKYRFCLSGTPLQNSIVEYYSLVKFLRIKPYCEWEKFRIDIDTPIKSAHDDIRANGMQRLQALCRAIMLRRTKKSTFEGKPILVLPERSTTVDNPVFDEHERAFYSALESQTQLTFNKYLRRGQVGQQYSAILTLLLRLRQCCCQNFGMNIQTDLNEEQMLDFARQLDPAVVSRIKEAGGNFECPVCYDVTSNPALIIPCGHDTCAECFSRIVDPANAIQNGDENAGARCPECRGPIDAKRITDFLSFKKVHMPELLTQEERESSEVVEEDSSDSDESSSEDEDEEESADPTLDGFIVPDDEDDYEPEEDDEREEGAPGPSKKSKQSKSTSKKSKKGKGKKKSVTLAELKAKANRNKDAKKKYLKRLEKGWVSSAKIEKTMEILKDIMDDEEGEKVLIFSQWTSLLDLLEVPISKEGYGYRRYDGSMSAAARGDAVDDFRSEQKNVRIMLVSLKAGNAGLNLNMASQVIILDPFWNPYVEEQAIDRAHRLGQTRPVTVHRILIESTVEDRILALQEKKRALISEALDEQKAGEIGRLGVQELAYLFGVTHDPSARIEYRERQRR
ncbi:hypothetical protein M409DRAFT_51976 [Zasmidium cellare ATCC 36951]|uniref:RING-type domain-containing protein n=1 Tax=Zasmidium cellare ATCC 36951 TaxID=1080233 RepID=A0A6A6CSV6_ZASCE|nr:uncharacterized protein M409DRAFT_51976 [Zasmidium cellare ATCC 36951]KAF2170234.1 hypothetical protein M409DRAFT_51976 [Zasmidium cellare ATCC 36951]